MFVPNHLLDKPLTCMAAVTHLLTQVPLHGISLS